MRRHKVTKTRVEAMAVLQFGLRRERVQGSGREKASQDS